MRDGRRVFAPRSLPGFVYWRSLMLTQTGRIVADAAAAPRAEGRECNIYVLRRQPGQKLPASLYTHS